MTTSQESVFKINEVIFSYLTNVFAGKVSQKLNDSVKSCSCPNCNIKTVPNNDAISG